MNETLPATGTYAARVRSVRRFDTACGPQIGFELELLDGHPGARVLASAADNPDPRGKLGSDRRAHGTTGDGLGASRRP